MLIICGPLAAGRPPIKLIRIPRFAMRTAVLVVPIAREMAEMDYQWYEPFRMEATETAETFGLTATDLDSAIRAEVGAIPTGPAETPRS